jgi:hypothetical protein
VEYDARYGVPACQLDQEQTIEKEFSREACWAPTVFKWPFSFTGFSTAAGGRQEVYLKRFWLLMCDGWHCIAVRDVHSVSAQDRNRRVASDR